MECALHLNAEGNDLVLRFWMSEESSSSPRSDEADSGDSVD
jgi:hypothetical protein